MCYIIHRLTPFHQHFDNIHSINTLMRWYRYKDLIKCYLVGFNTLWLSDAIWRHKSGSAWVQVIAHCLTEPSYHRDHHWHIINGFCHSRWISQEVLKIADRKMNLNNTPVKFLPHPPRGQPVKGDQSPDQTIASTETQVQAVKSVLIYNMLCIA